MSSRLLRQLTWWIADIDSWLVILVIIGVILILTRWWKVGRVLLVIAAFFFYLVCVSPIPDLLGTYLENRFQRPVPMPSDITGFIVIGFGIDRRVTQERDFITFNCAAQREITLVELYKKYPNKKFVYTAGGAKHDSLMNLTDLAKKLFKNLTLESPDHIVFEDQAWDTRDNADYTYQLVKPQPNEKWVLVTSAINMPRAIGTFKKVGWKHLIPYPVDYRTIKRYDLTFNFSLTHGFMMWKLLTYELLGLINYRLAGYIDELIPSPEPPKNET